MGSLNKTPGRCEVVLESNVLLAFSGYIFGESGMKDITREIQLVSSIDIESRDIEEVNEVFFTLLDCLDVDEVAYGGIRCWWS